MATVVGNWKSRQRVDKTRAPLPHVLHLPHVEESLAKMSPPTGCPAMVTGADCHC